MRANSPLPLCYLFFILVPPTLVMASTSIAAALITPSPVYRPGLLQKRASDQTCGYISGDPNSSLVCPGTSTCSFILNYWGCCDQLVCDTPATCELDSTPYCGGVFSAECAYSQIRRCSDACVKYVRETGPADSKTIFSWGCGPTATDILVLAGTTTGASSITSNGSGGGGTTSDQSRSTSISSGTYTTSSSTESPLTQSKSTPSSGGTGTASSFSTSTSSGSDSVTGTITSASTQSSTQTTTTRSSTPSTHHVLTKGGIAGITVASLVVFLFICVGAYVIYKKPNVIRRKKAVERRRTEEDERRRKEEEERRRKEEEERHRIQNETLSGLNDGFVDDRSFNGDAVEMMSQPRVNANGFDSVYDEARDDDDMRFQEGRERGRGHSVDGVLMSTRRIS